MALMFEMDAKGGQRSALWMGWLENGKYRKCAFFFNASWLLFLWSAQPPINISGLVPQPRSHGEPTESETAMAFLMLPCAPLHDTKKHIKTLLQI
jgi:hypothetical protein